MLLPQGERKELRGVNVYLILTRQKLAKNWRRYYTLPLGSKRKDDWRIIYISLEDFHMDKTRHNNIMNCTIIVDRPRLCVILPASKVRDAFPLNIEEGRAASKSPH